MKQFTQNGVTLVFYKKENDEKYSFAIKGDDELTERLLESVLTKRVREKDLHFAQKGIFEKIEQNLITKTKTKTKTQNEMENPIVQLAELCQSKFRSSMLTRVAGKTGPDHNPTITVEIELPNGKVYTAYGINQKTAKQKAAERALAEF